MVGTGAVSITHPDFYNHSRPPHHICTFRKAQYPASQHLRNHPWTASGITMENSLTPALVSPDTKTPSPATKLNPTNGISTNGAERAGSEPVDPTALSKALKNIEDAGRVRERTPGASPSRKRQRVYGDRSVNVAIAVSLKGF